MPGLAGGSWGLVVERKRQPDELDGIVWFCDRCDAKLYERRFPLTDIETEILAAINDFYSSSEHRTCKHCGAVLEKPGEFRL